MIHLLAKFAAFVTALAFALVSAFVETQQPIGLGPTGSVVRLIQSPLANAPAGARLNAMSTWNPGRSQTSDVVISARASATIAASGNLSDGFGQIALTGSPSGASIAPSIQSFGATSNTGTSTCETTAGSSQLKGCSNPADFLNGHGIIIDHVGSAPLAGTPTGVKVTSCGDASSALFQCATGNVTLYYALVPVDVGHGYGAPSLSVSTTTASTPTPGTSNYVNVKWTNSVSNAPIAYCVYAGSTPTTMVYTDLIPGYTISWNDYGHGPISADFCPAALPTGPANDALIGQIFSGGGTVTVNLNVNAGISTSSALMQHDNKLAMRNAAGTSQMVSVPCGTYLLNEAGYNVHMPAGSGFVGVSSGCSRFQLTAGIAYQAPFYASGAGVVMSDISLDSGGFWSSYEPLFQCASCVAPKFLNLTISRMSKFGVTLDSGSSDALFDNPDITAPTPMVEPQNAIVVTGAPRTIIRNPKIRGTQIGMVSFGCQVFGGSILGYRSGAGIVLLQGANSSNCTLAGTEISSGAPPGWLDVSHTTPSGVETYASNSSLVNLNIHDNPGVGISQGGKNGRVIGNLVVNNGLGGIGIDMRSATYNGGGSIFEGNQAFTTSGATNQQPYGIFVSPGDGGASNAKIGMNQLAGNAKDAFGPLTGAETFLSMTTAPGP